MRLNAEIAWRIVDRVSTGLKKRVSVVDATGYVFASTESRLVGTPHVAAQHAMAHGDIVAFDDHQLAGISLPLVYADAIVGAIVLGDASGQDLELGRVAKTLAELIIHQMSVIERLPQEKRVRDKFIYDLLHERFHGTPEVMVEEAEVLGIDLRVPRIVVVIDFRPLVERRMPSAIPADSLPTIARALRLEQIHANLLDRLREIMPPNDADVFSFIDDHRLIVLAAVDPAAPDIRRQRLERDIQQLLDSFARTDGVTTSAGMGWYHPCWQGLAQSCVEAQFALEMGDVLCGAGGVFCVEKLGLASFVCGDDRAMKAELARHVLQPIDDRPELLETLATFLEMNLASTQTAQALHIHRHTLDYRLSKIAQLIGLDPRQFQAATQLQAALLLRKMQQTQTLPT